MLANVRGTQEISTYLFVDNNSQWFMHIIGSHGMILNRWQCSNMSIECFVAGDSIFSGSQYLLWLTVKKGLKFESGDWSASNWRSNGSSFVQPSYMYGKRNTKCIERRFEHLSHIFWKIVQKFGEIFVLDGQKIKQKSGWKIYFDNLMLPSLEIIF